MKFLILILTALAAQEIETFTDVPLARELPEDVETFTDEPDPVVPTNGTIGDCVLPGSTDECDETSHCILTTDGAKCVCLDHYEIAQDETGQDTCVPVTTDWTIWGTCSLTCGGGRRVRSRQVAGITQEQIGGCNTESCPVDVDNMQPCTCDNGLFKCESTCARGNHCQRTSLTTQSTACFDDSLGACSAWGDPHIRTFDGQLIDVYGVGTYVFVRLDKFQVAVGSDYFDSSASTDGFDTIHLEVLMNTYKCGSVSCAESFTTTGSG